VWDGAAATVDFCREINLGSPCNEHLAGPDSRFIHRYPVPPGVNWNHRVKTETARKIRMSKNLDAKVPEKRT